MEPNAFKRLLIKVIVVNKAAEAFATERNEVAWLFIPIIELRSVRFTAIRQPGRGAAGTTHFFAFSLGGSLMLLVTLHAPINGLGTIF